ncbi:ABC transporter substrate-binding protein [Frigoribacterium sp. 2-23]|uniref:ABC transporter substrate-binding protein n=1 Tax=Frigoribacterium sp. 2-23 TaxID=3415006 RepID=UPI003C6FB34A
MSPLSRRHLLGLGLSAGAAALLAGCATPGTTSVNSLPTIPPATGGGPVKLQYWAWLKGLDQVCKLYNQTHSDIQVEAVFIPGGNAGGYQKLYSALAAGAGPDIAQVEMRSLPEFLLANGLVDLKRYGAAQYADLYDPTLWNQVSYTDGIYAIPQDSGPVGMYYRPDLLETVGAQAPASWDDWSATGLELKKNGVLMDVFPLSDASVFTAYATQAGAAWLRPEDDGWVIDMTDEATMTVARFFDKAIDDGIVSTSYTAYSPAWFAAAGNDKLAGCITGSWGDALIEGVSNASGKWKVAAMPTWTDLGYKSSFLGGSTAAILANSKHPQEALDFTVWMTTTKEGIDAMIKYCGIGWSPARGEIGTTRQQPSEFFSGQNYNEEVFVPATEESSQNQDWSWWPITQQSFNILSDGFRGKASGGTLVDAVAQAEKQIISVFQNKGLSIRKASA